MRGLIALIVCAATATAACGNPPFDFSEPLEFQLNANAGMSISGTTESTVQITTPPTVFGLLRVTYRYYQLTTACCLPDATCAELAQDECMAMGGTVVGPQYACGGVDCTDPVPVTCTAPSGPLLDIVEEQRFSLTLGVHPFTFPGFDPAGGNRALVEIEVFADMGFGVGVTFENDSVLPAPDAALNVTGIITVQSAFAAPLTALLNETALTDGSITASDGVPGSGTDFWDFGFVSDSDTATEIVAGNGEAGACVLADGCELVPCAECLALAGTFMGAGSLCPPGPGACCLPDGSCMPLLETECLGAFGFFNGCDVACESVACPTPGPVRDWITNGIGAFDDAANWIPHVPPAEGATARFARSPTVQLSRNETCDQFRVESGDVTLEPQGFTLTLDGASGVSLVVGGMPAMETALTIGPGDVEAAAVNVGAPTTNDSTLRILPLASLTTLENLCVGCMGPARLVIESDGEDGGLVVSRDAVIGAPGDAGHADLGGPGARWLCPLFLLLDNGTVTIRAGAVLETGFGLFVFQNGSVTGDGLIEGPVINLGEIEVAGSQVLVLDGNFDQLGEVPQLGALSGSLRSGLSEGAGPGDITFGGLSVLGTASLGGGLILDGTGATEIPLGEINIVLDATVLDGTFDVVALTGFGADKVVSLDYPESVTGGGQVTVVVNAVDSVFDYESSDNDIVGGTPTDVAVADLDEDGDIDLAVAVANADDALPGAVVILENQGTQPDGTWNGYLVLEPIAVGRIPSAIAVGNFDLLDTRPDLAVTNAGDDSITLLRNDGGLAFSSAGPDVSTADQPLDIAADDIDGDGFDDLVVAGFGDDTVRVLVRTGDFAFNEVAALAAPGGPCALDPEDLDEDRDTDLVVGLCLGNEVRVIRQDGGGGSEWELAEPFPVGGDPRSLGVSDLDGDGFPDIVTANAAGGSISVLRNLGPAGFQPAVTVAGADNPRSLVFADLDGDGDDDLAYTAIVDGGRELLTRRNDSDGTGAGIVLGEELTEDEELENPVFVAAADIDADGATDLVTISEPDGAGPGIPGGATALLAVPSPVIGDVNDDGQVDFVDVLLVLSGWGPCPDCPQDLDGDGAVGLADLLIVLSNWS